MNHLGSEMQSKSPPRSTVMAPGYCNQMFNGKATAMPLCRVKAEVPQPVHGTYANE